MAIYDGSSLRDRYVRMTEFPESGGGSGGGGGGGSAFATELGLYVFTDANGGTVYLERVTDENTGVTTDTYYDAPSGGNVVPAPPLPLAPYNAPDAVYALAVTSSEYEDSTDNVAAGFSALTFTNMGSDGDMSTINEPAVIAGRELRVGESVTFGGHPATLLPVIAVDSSDTIVRAYEEKLA